MKASRMVLFVLLLSLSAAFAASDQLSVREVPLGKRDANTKTYLKGTQLVLVKKCDGGEYAVVDGKEHKCYGDINGPVVFSPDGRRVAYVALRDGEKVVVCDGKAGTSYKDYVEALGFSPDGSRFAYVVKQGSKGFMVVDGVEGKLYDSLLLLSPKGIFSPDSKRFAYIGLYDNRPRVVVDGKEESGVIIIENNQFGFAPVGHMLAYGLYQDGKMSVVVDGVKWGAGYDNVSGPLYSPDGKRAAFVVTRNKKTIVVADGKESAEYAQYLNSGPVFSDDGSALSFLANNDGKAVPVLNGQEMQTDIRVKQYFVSPNGKRLALFGQKEGGEYVFVVDGKEEPQNGFELEGYAKCFFSPDSKRFIYSAKKQDQSVIVENGKASQAYSWVFEHMFSPDGSKLAYVARVKPTQPNGTSTSVVVINGEESRAYDKIVEQPVFSSDGKRVAFLAMVGTKYVVVCDGEESKLYEDVSTENLRFTPYGRHFTFTASQNSKGCFVVDGKEYESINFLGKPVFSPDGKHIAYIVKHGDKVAIVIDGKETGEYDSILERPYPEVPLLFEDSDTLCVIATRGDEVLRVEVKAPDNQ